MRDLLNGFGGRGSSEDSAEEEEEDSGEIELSLGLSLGGCFGVDPKRKGLARSSSVASMLVGGGEEEVERRALVRTCSLPVETEEEQRKRKSMQTMRRMEAKRRRMEKRGGRWSSWGGSGKEEEEEEEGWSGEKCGVPKGKVEVGRGGVGLEDGGVGAAAVVKTVSQRLIRSQGSCPTDAGSLDGGGVVQGSKGTANTERSPSIMQTGPSWAVNRVIQPIPVAANGMSKKLEERSNGLMEQMPCVLTRGEGPNGRVVEGFLYKYKKGEEVKIVCVCHGRFLTPAEFVRHAGGGDVTYPLRHIVVKPSPSPSL